MNPQQQMDATSKRVFSSNPFPMGIGASGPNGDLAEIEPAADARNCNQLCLNPEPL